MSLPWAPAVIALTAVAACAGGCGTVDPEPLPPAPHMIGFTEDLFDEHGIRPDAGAPDPELPGSGGIIVEWRRLAGAELGGVTVGGCKLYRADTTDSQGRPGAFSLIATISELGVDSDTSVTDTSVDANVRYWYVVRAFARNSGVEGPPSDTVHFSLTARPVPIAPIGELDSSSLPLRFRVGPSLLGGEVAIRLDRVHPENPSVVLDTVWRSHTYSTFAEPEVVYDGPPLVAGAQYRWRVDKVFGTQPVGNASRWVSFVAP
jgi:hypothetical protein